MSEVPLYYAHKKTPSPVGQTRASLTVEAAMEIKITIVFTFHVSRSLAHSLSVSSCVLRPFTVSSPAWQAPFADINSASFSFILVSNADSWVFIHSTSCCICLSIRRLYSTSVSPESRFVCCTGGGFS